MNEQKIQLIRVYIDRINEEITYWGFDKDHNLVQVGEHKLTDESINELRYLAGFTDGSFSDDKESEEMIFDGDKKMFYYLVDNDDFPHPFSI